MVTDEAGHREAEAQLAREPGKLVPVVLGEVVDVGAGLGPEA